MSSIEDYYHDPLRAWVTMADGQIMASMTLAAGYELHRLADGQTALRHAAVPEANHPATYNAQQAALCGAAYFDDEQWGKGVLRTFVQADPDARGRAIEDRFADEAKAALTQFNLPLAEYLVAVSASASGSEVTARVDLTHHSTGATISVENMHLALDTGEVMTPSHLDHEGTGMLLFP